MMIARKGDGNPPYTVDLSPLNKHCIREVHTNKSPFELARCVPANMWRTVMDAWNGFHSVPLRNLTTPTPIECYRYRRAPQGFPSSGDEVLADFKCQKRCVDDTLISDHDFKSHWWRKIVFLETVGRVGRW